MNGWNETFLNPNPNAIPNRNPNRELVFLGGNLPDTGKNKRKEWTKKNKK